MRPAPARPPHHEVDTARQHLDRYAPAYLRAGLYAAMLGFISFKDTFEKISAEQLAAMSPLQFTCLFLTPVIAVIGAIVAFLDQTLARINAKRADEESRAPFGRT